MFQKAKKLNRIRKNTEDWCFSLIDLKRLSKVLLTNPLHLNFLDKLTDKLEWVVVSFYRGM